MARLIDENFEGTGYEESWSETVTAGNTLDEDSTIPGTPPPGAGSQCLKIIVGGGTVNAFAMQTKTNQNISYTRSYIYVTEEGMSSGQIMPTQWLRDSANAFVTDIVIGDVSGVLKLYYAYWSDGAIRNSSQVTINLNTWYRVEYKYDVTNLAWEWKLDGVTQESGSLISPRTPDRMRIGCTYNGSGQSTFYQDLVVWDDAGWVGEESVATPSITRRIRGYIR